MSRPLIGVTTHAKHWCPPWWAIRYCVSKAGGIAVRISPRHGVELARLDGLVISGGSDLSPSLYGQLPREDDSYDLARDKVESQTLAFAKEHQLPVLGICRGSQLMNVSLGGDLFQDISSRRQHTPNGIMLLPRKTARLADNSLIAELVGSKQTRINSIHHQAMNRLGEGFVVTARDADDFVQAIEHQSLNWLGVQWHPEYLFYLSAQIRLFHWLVEQAKQKQKMNSV